MGRDRSLNPFVVAAGLILAAGCGEQPPGRGSPDARAEGPGGGPLARLECAEDSIDFGRVWEGSVLEHEFRLRSGGDVDFELGGLSADCGCTTTDLQVLAADGSRTRQSGHARIPSGTELALKVTFDTKGRPGAAKRRVHVTGNIPGGRRTLGIRAEVVPWLRATPDRIVLGEMSVLETRESEVSVVSTEGERFGLSHLREAIPPQLGVHLEPRDPADDGRASEWRVRLVAGPDMPEGVRSYPIKLVSDRVNPSGPMGSDGSRATFVVEPKLQVVVVGVISVGPTTLAFGVMGAQEKQSRTAHVVCHDPDFVLPEPRVTLGSRSRGGKAMAWAETAHVTIRPVEGENAWDIELLMDGLADDVVRTILGELVIETGHPDDPEVRVPVTGLRRVGTARGR